MIQFSELRISENKKQLSVGCYVENFDIYDDVYIKSIYVEYYKNRLENGDISEKAICIYDNTNDDYTVKSAHAVLMKQEITEEFGTGSFDNGLFYVYVICDVHGGASLASADCGWDIMKTVGIVADWERVYRAGMAYILDVADGCHTCVISDEFIDFIMRWNALRLAMLVCDYITVDMLWDKFLGYTTARRSSCGCM